MDNDRTLNDANYGRFKNTTRNRKTAGLWVSPPELIRKPKQPEFGYYSVNLTDYNIQAELTATTRSSLQRYTFNKAEQPRILVDFFFPAEYDWNLDDV